MWAARTPRETLSLGQKIGRVLEGKELKGILSNVYKARAYPELCMGDTDLKHQKP